MLVLHTTLKITVHQEFHQEAKKAEAEAEVVNMLPELLNRAFSRKSTQFISGERHSLTAPYFQHIDEQLALWHTHTERLP